MGHSKRRDGQHMVNMIGFSSLTCQGDCVCAVIMSCLVSRSVPSLQVLSVDWNKYNENVLVSGSVDRTLRVWVRLPVCIHVHMYACWCMLCACWCLLPACPCILLACLCMHPSRCTRACRHASRMRCLPCAAASVLWCAFSGIHRCPLQLAAGPCVHRLPAVPTANLVFQNDPCTVSPRTRAHVKDIRSPVRPLSELKGHTYAVRRVKCSPHDESIVASCSYDMSVCLWNTKVEDSLMARYGHHSEFVVGLDFSMFQPGLIASGSWDGNTAMWNTMGPGPPPLAKVPMVLQ